MIATWARTLVAAVALAASPAVQARACDDSPAPRRGSAPTILRDLALSWTQGFARKEGGAPILLAQTFRPPQGSLDPALAAFLDGRADFAFLTRDISESDLVTFRRAHGRDPVVIPVAGGGWNRFGLVDAVAIVVNKANPVPHLSYRQLDAIFSRSRLRGGTVEDWGVLGVRAWRGRPIHLVGGGAWEGEESARALTIRRRILSVGSEPAVWRTAPATGGEADMVSAVAADPFAIGFTGLGHVGPGVRTVPVGKHAHAFAPTLATIASGKYPLARTVDLLLARRRDRSLDPALVCFADYLLGRDGQEVIRSDGTFLPLASTQLRLARRQLRLKP